MKTAVIGGGAAGLCAAVQAKRFGQDVVIYERLDRIGKKLLATGNGRCNLMNTGPLLYPRGGTFVQSTFKTFSPYDLSAFFEGLGLNLREEAQGRVYPATGQAASVLNVLMQTLTRLNIPTRCETKIERILPVKGGYEIEGEFYHKVIIATGGRAQEKLGSDGSGLKLLKDLGHCVYEFSPSLTAMETDTAVIKGLSGIRVKADIALEKHGNLLNAQSGELLFTDYGLSGVCVMQLSAFYEKDAKIIIDLSKAMNLQEDAHLFFKARRDRLNPIAPKDFLTGLFATPLCHTLTKLANLTDLSDEALLRLSRLITRFELPILRLKGFEQAQVSRGGAALGFFDPTTMESSLHKGLYAVGEVLDVDGDCGGFNLMFAFISGIIAGQQA